MFFVPGKWLNPYALGDLTRHPPPSTPANVMFIDLCVDPNTFPSCYNRYLPNVNLRDDESTNVLCVVTTVDLEDDSELFVDYWTVVTFEQEMVPPGLSVPSDGLSKYFVKRKYDHSYHLARQLIAKTLWPQAVVDKFSLDKMVEEEVRLLAREGKEGSRAVLGRERGVEELEGERGKE